MGPGLHSGPVMTHMDRLGEGFDITSIPLNWGGNQREWYCDV